MKKMIGMQTDFYDFHLYFRDHLHTRRWCHASILTIQ